MGGGTENLNAGHLVPFYGHEEERPGRVAGYPHREAAANAVIHARSAFTVDLAIRPDGLRRPPRSP